MGKKVVILGAGLSGLASTYFLEKKYPDISCTLLESSKRTGGWIQSVKKEGFLCELGPHSLRASGGQDTLALIEKLGLNSQMIFASSKAKERYLLIDKKLEKVPSKPWEMLTPLFLNALLRDLFASKGVEDESIYTFAKRRFGGKMATLFFDPLVSGIFAGDIHKLSIRSVFPILAEWEKKYGSVFLGILRSKKEKKLPIGIYSFKDGIETLPKAIAAHIKAPILLETKVKKITPLKEGLEISLQGGEKLYADQIISTLPARELLQIINCQLLESFESATVGIVHLGFHQNILNKQGFGYLIPSSEQEKILGVIWDSQVFPQQNKHNQTRLTVMCGGTRHKVSSIEECIDNAIDGVSRHMKLTLKPDMIHSFLAKEAITQYVVGHDEKIRNVKRLIDKEYPGLHLLGTTFSGISINDCIRSAKEIKL